MESVKLALGQTALQLLAATFIACLSLWFVLKRAVEGDAFQFTFAEVWERLDQAIAELRFTIREVLRFLLRLLSFWYLLKVRTGFGRVDIAVTGVVFALAIPTVLDVVVVVIKLIHEVVVRYG